MEFSSEDLKQIQAAGQLNYSPENICILLNISKVDEFIKLFNNQNSEVRKKYEAGKANAQMTIGKKLFDIAKKGDVETIELMRKIEKEKRFNNLKKELFGL